MILESLVTTWDSAGNVNLAPMGPVVDDDGTFRRFRLRPFQSSTTYANLVDCPRAVVHVTDDAALLARAAMQHIDAPGLVRPISLDELGSAVGDATSSGVESNTYWRLIDCHRWFAVHAVSIDASQARTEMNCRVVASGVVRPFFGFNRAKHAVLEAAILATRTHLIPAEEIQSQFEQLRPLIEKTAGTAERAAFAELDEHIQQTINA